MSLASIAHWCVEKAAYIVHVADFLAFLGSVVLGWEVIQREREFNHMTQMTASLATPLAKLKIEREGITITSQDDVKRVFLRRAKKKAILGVVLITIGFVVSVLCRWAEARK